MKKYLLLLTLIFSLLISNVYSQTVHVTKTGKKYHDGNCRYLSKSSYSISLEDAKARGYDPCSVCNPSSSSEKTTLTPAQTKKKEPQTDNPQAKQSTKSVQCSSTTKAGNRCSRMTTSSNGRCWQHGGN
jgi:hypothetical protein